MKGHERIDSVDLYACRSPLRALEPGGKIFFMIFILLLCLFENKIGVSVYVMCSMTILNVWKNRIPVSIFLKLMCIPLAFILPGCAAIAAEIGYGAGGWYIHVTGESAKTAAGVAFRALGAVSVLYFLTLSTPVWEIVSALRKMHVPNVMTELMNMIYRYIFILMDVQFRLKHAAESRLGYQDFKTSCRTFGNSMGSLFMISLKKAGMYYDAMESRCYDGELCFLEEEKRTGGIYYLAGTLYAVSVLAMGRFT